MSRADRHIPLAIASRSAGDFERSTATIAASGISSEMCVEVVSVFFIESQPRTNATVEILSNHSLFHIAIGVLDDELDGVGDEREGGQNGGEFCRRISSRW